jgi:protein subunit release factor B
MPVPHPVAASGVFLLSPETIDKIKARMALASVFEEDLQESFILGSGPGGQKTNKTSSTVRLYHVPSGMTIKYGRSRSREANRWLARRELAEKILERAKSELSARRQADEKIRRQKRRRSRRQKARMLDEKRKHSEKKAARARVEF